LIKVRQWLCKKLQVYPEFFDIIKLYFETNPKIFAEVVHKAILRIYPYKTQINEDLIHIVIQMTVGGNFSTKFISKKLKVRDPVL